MIELDRLNTPNVDQIMAEPVVGNFGGHKSATLEATKVFVHIDTVISKNMGSNEPKYKGYDSTPSTYSRHLAMRDSPS